MGGGERTTLYSQLSQSTFIWVLGLNSGLWGKCFYLLNHLASPGLKFFLFLGFGGFWRNLLQITMHSWGSVHSQADGKMVVAASGKHGKECNNKQKIHSAHYRLVVTYINSFSSYSSFCHWENQGIDLPSNLTMVTYLLSSKANSSSTAQGSVSLISGLYSVFAFPWCSLPLSHLPVVFWGEWGHFSEASQRLLLFLIGSHWLLNQSDHSF